ERDAPCLQEWISESSSRVRGEARRTDVRVWIDGRTVDLTAARTKRMCSGFRMVCFRNAEGR
ncbi:hypothetical protein, partial [Methylobacterium bullatum]|uniref:hypothetical protein n=1 Tax=Methylobacterium bullatum TaxID=570505 RepID=UPI001AEE23F5